MDTIALWEQEIIESNRSHFFEELEYTIDYLMESINIDYKLLDMGIFTEADEEETKDDDNSDSKDKSTLKLGMKIKLVVGKIAMGLTKIALKVREFIKNKIQDFKQKNIIKKFAAADINPEQMAEKLNKRNIFNPSEMYSVYAHNGVFGHFCMEFIGAPITSVVESDIKIVDEYNGLVSELESFFTAADLKDKEKFFVKIDPKNAKQEITRLYEETVKYLDLVTEEVEKISKTLKEREKEAESLKDKEKIKAAKGNINLYKSTYKGATRIEKLYLKQADFLQALMVSFAMHKEDKTEEEK